MKKLIIALGLGTALLFPSAAGATGLMTCDSGDPSTWKTKEQLTAKMEAEGWKVNRIKVDGNCYEAYGDMPNGGRRNVEAYYHPVTLELLLIARFGRVYYEKK